MKLWSQQSNAVLDNVTYQQTLMWMNEEKIGLKKHDRHQHDSRR